VSSGECAAGLTGLLNSPRHVRQRAAEVGGGLRAGRGSAALAGL